jgi:VWFA-related protein
MHQRPKLILSRAVLFGSALALFAQTVAAQTAVPDENGRLVFKANVRTVVLNVVVTGRDGKPVQGLRKEDFSLAEDGRPQFVTYFEEHTGAHPVEAARAKLPPNVFTNVPPVKPSDAVTVLLLDSMNTQLQDQAFVHAQMLKYLQNVPPGTRMAIFALGARLRFVQGFTDDAALLSAALRDPKLGAGPQHSPLLLSPGEAAAQQQGPALVAQANAENPSPATAAAAAFMQQFLAEQNAAQNDLRVVSTLGALQQLAAYLAGIPGRKNVVWFSSAFPLVLFANPSLSDSFAVQRSYEREVRKTDSMLATAQVAIYPVAAEGLASDSTHDAETQLVGVTSAQAAQQQLGQSLQNDALLRNGSHGAMDEIAQETGGIAYYNGNGLAGAVARIVDQGSYFYTLTYTPTNPAPDGKFRKIQVKLAKADGAKLSYRRGYYAAEPKEAKAEAAKPAGDPLHPYMGPGMPASTQIPMALRLQRGATRPAADPALKARNQPPPANQAGDNPDLRGALTRYKVDFVVAASGLQLDAAPDGSRHGKIESTLVVYDRDGRALNWMVRQIDLDMDAARYAQVKENGVNFALEIDVPEGAPGDAAKSGVSLRAGVFDLDANLAGTLEVPLSSVAGPAQNSHL